MSEHWTSRKARQSRLAAAAAIVVLGALAAAVVVLEQGRSRRLIADDVKLWQDEDGTIRGAHFVTDEVTEDHWSLLEGAAESLQSVNLSNTEQVAGGLQRLAAFMNLRDLYLADCGWLDDAAVTPIAKAHRLHSLDISGTPLTDEGLRQFDLSELTNLTADRCSGLTDATFEMLMKLDALKAVSLRGQEVSLDQFARMKTLNPELALVAGVELTWTFVDRRETTSLPVNWLTDETDIDEFLRYWKRHVTDSVRHLALGGPGVDRLLPRILAEMPDLESLILLETKLSGGLEALPPSVTTLRLAQLHAGTRLGDLKSITGLKSVYVRDIELTSEQWAAFFAMIAANKSLVQLSLIGAIVPSDAFRTLREHRQLRHLGLYNVRIMAADLKVIGQISSIETLDTDGFPISDAVVESWLQLPGLTYVDIQGGGISPEMEQRLRERYPSAQIHIR